MACAHNLHRSLRGSGPTLGPGMKLDEDVHAHSHRPLVQGMRFVRAEKVLWRGAPCACNTGSGVGTSMSLYTGGPVIVVRRHPATHHTMVFLMGGRCWGKSKTTVISYARPPSGGVWKIRSARNDLVARGAEKEKSSMRPARCPVLRVARTVVGSREKPTSRMYNQSNCR